VRRLASTFAFIVVPGLALAQSPSPQPSANVPHVHPAPGRTPAPHHGSPRPGHPSPVPSHSSHANNGSSHAPYQARINLTGADVQKILASPSPSAKPTKQPPSQSYPEPEVFHDTQTSN